MWTTKGAAAVTVLALAAGAALYASAALATGSGANAATVKVTMSEWKMRVVPGKATAGKVTFVVKNAGHKRHEFVVIKTNVPPSALPQKNGRASEKGSKGEIERIQPGATEKLTLNLASGKYVLICNLRNHYNRGQHAGFATR